MDTGSQWTLWLSRPGARANRLQGVIVMRGQDTHSQDIGIDVYFARKQGDHDDFVEVLEAWYHPEGLASPFLAGDGSLRPIEVPLGYFITELSCAGGNFSRLGALVLCHLVAPGHELPGTPDWLVEWHKAYRDPFSRYIDYATDHLDVIDSRGIKEAAERFDRWRNFFGPNFLWELDPLGDAEDAYMQISNPRDIEQRGVAWKEHGITSIQVPESFYRVRNSREAAIIEVWWCIANIRLVRGCRICGAWFIPSGRDRWDQVTCYRHQR